MGNCLVTKLNSVVNNDSLDKLGCLTIKIEKLGEWNEKSHTLYIQCSENFEVYCKSGEAHILDANNENPSSKKSYNGEPTVNKITFTDDDDIIYITKKYAIKKIWTIAFSDEYQKCWYLNIDQFRYSTIEEIQIINSPKTNGDISKISNTLKSLRLSGPLNVTATQPLPYTNLNMLLITGLPFIVDCEESVFNENLRIISIDSITNEQISRCKNLEDLTISKKIGADMRTLGKLTQLVRLYIGFRCDVSELTGTVNELIETFRANGKTSGSLLIPFIDRWPNTFTLDGTPVRNLIQITSDSKIIWTEDSITVEPLKEA